VRGGRPTTKNKDMLNTGNLYHKMALLDVVCRVTRATRHVKEESRMPWVRTPPGASNIGSCSSVVRASVLCFSVLFFFWLFFGLAQTRLSVQRRHECSAAPLWWLGLLARSSRDRSVSRPSDFMPIRYSGFPAPKFQLGLRDWIAFEMQCMERQLNTSYIRSTLRVLSCILTNVSMTDRYCTATTSLLSGLLLALVLLSFFRALMMFGGVLNKHGP